MPDPLIERYDASLQSGQTARERLADSKLKRASEYIQWTGKSFGPTASPVAGVRSTDTEVPPDWILPRFPPPSVRQQFEELQRQQLQQLAAAANAPPSYFAANDPMMSSLHPIGLPEQTAELRRQQKELWKKIVDELWRLEQAEYGILWRLYQSMVTEEYSLLAKPKASWSAAYAEFQQRGGIELYRSLRPVYFRAKIREPHKLIMQMISSNVTLAGVPVRQGVHPKFAKILERVDRAINQSKIAQFGIQPVKYIGCFRPSPLDSGGISRHMIGAAIDIDASIKNEDRNPHLRKPQLDALDEMLVFRAKSQASLTPGPTLTASGSWLAGVPNANALDRARELHARTVAISTEAKAFLDDWLDQWIALQKAPQSLAPGDKKDAMKVMDKLAKAFRGEKGLRNIQKGGIISIPLEVFEALAGDRDLRSGIQYDTTKDVMHFEVKRVAEFVGTDTDL